LENQVAIVIPVSNGFQPESNSLAHIRTILEYAREGLQKGNSWFSDWCQKRRCQSISRILSQASGPYHYDSEEAFNDLQNEFQPKTAYGYDAYSTWRRGVERTLKLIESLQCHRPGLNILDAACGDGMTGHAFSVSGHKVVLSDIEDRRDERCQKLPFVLGDMCAGLPVESDGYDLVCSYNAFEHLLKPAEALRELRRVCRPGGIIYLEVGPLYASPWGLHAYRTICAPYSQFLFSGAFLKHKLEELGVRDLGEERSNLQTLNQWRLSQFSRLWQDCGLEIVHLSRFTDLSCLHIIRRFPKAFGGRGLLFEDVTTQALYVTLRKT
jgi:ubiquinone/menaquinone biosynthesis C-methylase UbiE